MEKGLRDAGVAGDASVTHIFHCAYIMKDEPPEESEVGGRAGCPGKSWHALHSQRKRTRRAGMHAMAQLIIWQFLIVGVRA